MAPLTELARLEELLSTETGLAVVTTLRASGRPLSSVVNCGVIDHPVSRARVVAFVANGSSARLDHIRRNPTINLLARRGWDWAAVDGDAEIFGPDDPQVGVDADLVRLLVRAVYQAAGGTHDDFDEFDRVMAEEGRGVVTVVPRRYYTNPW